MSDDKPRILVFSAHAADFCSRCGGTIAKQVNAGGTVRIVALTYGEHGQSWDLWEREPERSVEGVKAIKRGEAETAANVLGAEIRFLDWSDHPLVIDKARTLHLVDEIREMRPHVILTHWPEEDLNPDHETTTEAVILATVLAEGPGLKTTYPHCPLPGMFFYESSVLWLERTGFNPDCYIDITDVFEQKMKALSVFQSQPGLCNWYTQFAQNRAWQARAASNNQLIKYAEGFKRYLPWVGEYLV